MENICAAIVIIYILTAFYKSYTWVAAYFRIRTKKYKKLVINSKTEKVPHLFICIPGLREQSIVKETIEYFEKFEYPKELLTIVIITTEKENYQKNKRVNEIQGFVKRIINNPRDSKLFNSGLFSRQCIQKVLELVEVKKENFNEACKAVTEYYQKYPTTKDLVEDELRNNKSENSLLHIHYPKTTGGKPEQLNYALSYIESLIDEKKVDPALCFIGVYDFDGRPDSQTGEEIAQLFHERIKNNKNLPSMIQQIQLPFSNLENLGKNKITGSFLRGNAILYLRRALGIELYKFQKMNYIYKYCKKSILNVFRRPVTYGIGSGMFVNYKALKRIGNFPTPMEDLATGYRMSFLGEEMIPLKSFNMMEAYDSYKQMSNAGSISFRGAFRIIKDYQQMLSKDTNQRLTKGEKIALVCKEWAESTLWLIGNITLLFAYIYLTFKWGLSSKLILLVIPLIIRFYLDTIGLNIVMEKICMEYKGNKLNNVKSGLIEKLLIVVFSPVQGIVRMIAPFKALKFLLFKYVLKIDVEQSKTER